MDTIAYLHPAHPIPAERTASRSLVVLLTSGPEDGGTRATLALSAAVIAVCLDHRVQLFMVGAGALLGLRGTHRGRASRWLSGAGVPDAGARRARGRNLCVRRVRPGLRRPESERLGDRRSAPAARDPPAGNGIGACGLDPWSLGDLLTRYP